MMKRTFTFVACMAALILTACTSESQLPTASGKGGVRGINAMPGSPAVTFRIEERSLGTLKYKESSTPALYDNFEYNFNFDINIPGEDEPQRIATIATQIEDGQDHVFVLSGDLTNPVVTTWVSELREWNDTDTVFEAQFAHLAESLGDVDVYFYEESGSMPVQGEQVATLSYGEVMNTADFEEGSYVALVTAAGDISTVYHSASAVALTARSSHLISIFDGDDNDTSPYILWSMSATGVSRRLTDPSYNSTVRFVHGASTLPAVDIYNDEALTNLVAANLSVGESTIDFDAISDADTLYFTPTGSTAAVLFSQALGDVPSSTPTDLYITGTTDTWVGVNLSQDRASAATIVKLSLYHSAFDAESMDLYVIDRGATLAEDALPRLSRINYALPSGTAALAAGSYDIYVTELFTKNVLGGPFELDIELGDVVYLLAYDDELNPGSVIIGDVSLP
jgi:hypothetical protein